MKTAAVIAETFERAGVTHAFGLVGSTVLSILNEIKRTEIEYISTRHEQVAASMAVGYSLVTREPTVSISHVGPGAANQVIGIAAAYRDNVPVISVTGNEPSHLLGRDVNHEWDVAGVFERFTKHSMQVTHHDPYDQVRNAVVRAVTGMPGPVHLDIPSDVADLDVPAPSERSRARLSGRDRRASTTHARPTEAAVTETAEFLADAERPLMVAGNEIRWFDATADLRRFAELVDIPVATTQNARGALPESHPLSIGYVANSRLEPANTYLESADLVIGVGTRFSDKATRRWGLIDEDAVLVQATIRAEAIERHYLADVVALTDPASFLAALTAHIEQAGPTPSFVDVAHPVHEAVDAARADMLTPEATNGDGVDPRRVVIAVDEFLNDYAYTTGGGVHNHYPRMLPVDDLNGRIVAANFTGMSQGFPLGMGAQLALDRPVVAFEGDGGFAMVVQDLETAVREDIPVKVIVLNNNAYMSHAVRQRAHYAGRYIGTYHGNPRFDKVAEAFGAVGLRVDSDDEVDAAVGALLDADGPGVLDVHVDPEIGAEYYV